MHTHFRFHDWDSTRGCCPPTHMRVIVRDVELEGIASSLLVQGNHRRRGSGGREGQNSDSAKHFGIRPGKILADRPSPARPPSWCVLVCLWLLLSSVLDDQVMAL
jgi:hypothetical protein